MTCLFTEIQKGLNANVLPSETFYLATDFDLDTIVFLQRQQNISYTALQRI
jgi:hypothetical protein